MNLNLEQNLGESPNENTCEFKHLWLNKIDKSFYKEIKYHKNDAPVLIIEIDQLIPLLKFLVAELELKFRVLADIIGIDFVWNSKYQKRFSVVYNLLSIKNNIRIFLQIFLNDDEEIPSAHELFDSATWPQREVYDMFGLRFKDALDNRRILTDYGFEHFPLRKDFPLTGYDEVRYDPTTQEVKYSPVKLDQDYRDFTFESPWAGVLQDDEEKS